ncbi:hypothetical protein D3C79_1122090 [compost metagenome]
MGEGLVIAVVVEFTAVVGGRHVVGTGDSGRAEADGEHKHQVGFFHGSTCEIGLTTCPQGH